MRPLALALAAAAAILLAVALAGAARAALDAFTPPTAAELAREYAELERVEREQARAAALAPLDTAIAALWRLLPLLAALGLLGYLGALGYAHVRYRARYAAPDSRGLVDVPINELDGVAPRALAAYHAARVAEAQRPLVPHTLSYHAPHYRGDPAALLPGAEVGALAAPVPAFAALLDAGRVGPNNPMLLGYDTATGAAVEGSWLDLYSCGLGGLSGSGKSWTATYLAAQAALFGTRIVLLDPHAEHSESLAARLAPLAPRFVCAPAESPREMLAAVELVAAELEARKRGRRGDPLLFIADEYSALQRGELAEPLSALVEALGQEGRKLGLYALVAGQVWSATRTGGTEVRDSLASAYVHRCRPAQARYLTGLTAADLPPDLLELPAGTAYLLDTAGSFRKVTIPQMTGADVARVAALVAGGPATPPPTEAPTGRRPVGFRPVGAGEGATVGAEGAPLRPQQDAPNLTAEDAAILAGFLAGKSLSELAAELNGGKAAGDGYAKAARRVADVLRRALGGKVAGNA